MPRFDGLDPADLDLRRRSSESPVFVGRATPTTSNRPTASEPNRSHPHATGGRPHPQPPSTRESDVALELLPERGDDDDRRLPARLRLVRLHNPVLLSLVRH